METTGWQKHTVRGFVSILGSKGGQKIESSKNAAGERSYRLCGAPDKSGSMRSTLLCGVGGLPRGIAAATEGFSLHIVLAGRILDGEFSCLLRRLQ